MENKIHEFGFIKGLEDLKKPDYQYPLIGLGGLQMLLAPSGGTSPCLDSAWAIKPKLFYEGWWTREARVPCFGIKTDFSPEPENMMEFSQRVDIAEGIAYTTYKKKVKGHIIKSRVTTFITPEPVIVHHYEDMAEDGFKDWARLHSIEAKEPDELGGKEGTAYTKEKSFVIWATKTLGSCKASLACATESSNRIKVQDGIIKAYPDEKGKIELTVFTVPGSSLFIDKDDFVEENRHKASVIALFGYKTNLDYVKRWWKRYWASSSLNLPDDMLTKWYIRSLYYLGLMSGKTKVALMDMLPVWTLWPGRVWAHDILYMHYGLLTGNRAHVSRCITDWYAKVLPAAQKNARECYGSGGARYGWGQNFWGEEEDFYPWSEQHCVNGEIAFQCISQALWTEDKWYLENVAKPVLKETTEFLYEHLKWDKEVSAYLSPESIDTDEPAGLIPGGVGVQTAILWSFEICKELGIFEPEWSMKAEHLYLPVSRVGEKEIMMVYKGDNSKRSICLPSPLIGIFWWPVIDPHSKLAKDTYADVRSRMDLEGIVPSFASPFLACQAARMGMGEDVYRLLADLISEKNKVIVDDMSFREGPGGHLTFSYFFTAHGALVSAVHEMLLQSYKKGEILLLPAIPDKWKDSSLGYKNLLAQGNISVSVDYNPERIVAVLENHGSAGQRSIQVPIPIKIETKDVSVKINEKQVSESDLDMSKGNIKVSVPLPALCLVKIIVERS